MSTREHNIPGPWTPHKWPAGADIGRLASAVGNILVSGPTNTQFPQIMSGQRYLGSREFDEIERLERQGRVHPYRSRRLAAMTLGNPEQAALPAGTKYPTGLQKMGKPLYTQFLEQRTKGPLLWAIIWDLLGLGEGSAIRSR